MIDIKNLKIPDSVLQLIIEEQGRQNGRFVPAGTDFLIKIASRAELIAHYNPSGELLGFVYFYANALDKNICYITLIATASNARSKGVGAALVNHVIQIGKSRGFLHCQLEVRVENHKAVNFYKKIGFTDLEDRQDKLLMQISLK